MIKILALLMLTNLFFSCPEDDKYCASCQGSQCKECWDSYLSEGKCVEPEEEISDCVQYLNENQCKLCKDGYYRTEDLRKCEEIEIENCIRLNSFGQCVLCERGMRIENGICND